MPIYFEAPKKTHSKHNKAKRNNTKGTTKHNNTEEHGRSTDEYQNPRTLCHYVTLWYHVCIGWLRNHSMFCPLHCLGVFVFLYIRKVRNIMGYFKSQIANCRECGEEINPARVQLGYRVCILCGEESARQERLSWCVVQEYGKGPYQLVTPTAAPTTLKQTNQKDPRV